MNASRHFAESRVGATLLFVWAACTVKLARAVVNEAVLRDAAARLPEGRLMTYCVEKLVAEVSVFTTGFRSCVLSSGFAGFFVR